MKQSTRIEIAKTTLQTIELGFYTNSKGDKVDIKPLQQKAEENTRLFTPDELQELLDETGKSNNFQTTIRILLNHLKKDLYDKVFVRLAETTNAERKKL